MSSPLIMKARRLNFSHGGRSASPVCCCCTATTPMPIAGQLAAGYRVAALSWSGMGGPGWRSFYSVAGYALEAMSAARTAGLFAASAPVIVGHSFGGSCVLEAAARYGDELAGVITLDSLLYPAAQKPTLPSRSAHRIHASLANALARFRLARNDRRCRPSCHAGPAADRN